MSSPLGEFGRIARFFAPLAAPGALGLRDDAALIDGPQGEHYVLTADAIVEGVHFLPGDPPFQVAQKLLRVNLSDLAAKGAEPLGYLLTTALPPSHGEAWLGEFSAGLAADQATYSIGLLGGDSVATSGPATLSVTAIGRIPQGQALLRSAAQIGDFLYVSGTLGDAALGLEAAQGGLPQLGGDARAFLADRYRLPQPRLVLGRRLLSLAHAAMDISDGLLADLEHICDASGVAAVVQAATLPLSPAAREVLAGAPDLVALVLGGGDDYELLFTAPCDREERIARLAEELGLPLTRIGRIEAGQGVTVLDADGEKMAVGTAGYRHF